MMIRKLTTRKSKLVSINILETNLESKILVTKI